MAGKPNIHADLGEAGGFFPRLFKALCEGAEGTFDATGSDAVREAVALVGANNAGSCAQCASFTPVVQVVAKPKKPKKAKKPKKEAEGCAS